MGLVSQADERALELDRRAFLVGGGAAVALIGATGAVAAPRRTGEKGIIDVHHHILPPRSGMPAQWEKLSGWSPANAVMQMDAAGIATGMAYSGPVLIGNPQEQQETARLWNEFGAGLGRTYPGRFGLLASLPFPHVDGCLAEIDYALDHLGADGFGIATSYGEMWLGDKALWPIYEKLNSRGAVVYLHPHNCPYCGPDKMSYERILPTAPGSEQSWIEWPMNTARTILSLMASGTLRRFPRIRFIVSHGGGVMPLLVERLSGFDEFVGVGPDKLKSAFPNGIQAEFRTLHFECAQAFSRTNMAALRSLVPDTQLVFGSDYFFFPLSHAARQFRELGLPPATARAIARDNAARLFPRFA